MSFERVIERASAELQRLGPNAEKALNKSIRSAGTSLSNNIKRSVTSSYEVSQAKLNQSTKVSVGRGDAALTLTFSGKRLNVVHFRNFPGTRHVNVWIKRGQSLTYKRSFYYSGSIWQRERGAGRLPIDRPMGPSVAQMVHSEGVWPEVSHDTEELMLRRFEQVIKKMGYK